MTAVLLLLSETVQLREPGTTTSRSGTTTTTWDTPVQVGQYQAAIQGLTGTENLAAGREGAVARFRVYMLPAAPVQRTSRLGWGDRTLEVVGAPRMVYDILHGQAHHWEIDSKEVVG